MSEPTKAPVQTPCPAIPHRTEVKAGKSILWCACGRSTRQPFCNFAHQGTGIEPVSYTPAEDLTVALCGCKRTRNPPFCDGSHAKPI
jgi:CDGSH-type Zn-finger protein